jgi:hypothetical protein
MTPTELTPGQKPSAVWLWGFWLYFASAVAVFVVSLYCPPLLKQILRGVAGALLVAGGLHQFRVIAYKRATWVPYASFGPDSLMLQRQTGRSAIVLGAAFIASAAVDM